MTRTHAFGIVGGYGATGAAVAAELGKACADEILIGGRDLTSNRFSHQTWQPRFRRPTRRARFALAR